MPPLRRRLAELPLFKAIRALSVRRDAGAIALFLAMGSAAVIILATPLSSGLVARVIAVHHYRPKSWPSWATLQLVPKMYSFAHTCWIGPAPLFDQKQNQKQIQIQNPRSEAERRFLRERFWVNHYPARRARFDGRRRELAGAERYIYVRTSYFGHTETTGFYVRVEQGRFLLRRREEAP
jgi:hypothetical protein